MLAQPENTNKSFNHSFMAKQRIYNNSGRHIHYTRHNNTNSLLVQCAAHVKEWWK